MYLCILLFSIFYSFPVLASDDQENFLNNQQVKTAPVITYHDLKNHTLGTTKNRCLNGWHFHWHIQNDFNIQRLEEAYPPSKYEYKVRVVKKFDSSQSMFDFAAYEIYFQNKKTNNHEYNSLYTFYLTQPRDCMICHTLYDSSSRSCVGIHSRTS